MLNFYVLTEAFYEIGAAPLKFVPQEGIEISLALGLGHFLGEVKFHIAHQHAGQALRRGPGPGIQFRGMESLDGFWDHLGGGVVGGLGGSSSRS